MSAAPKIIDKKTLQILVPFNALSPMHFNEVAQKTVVEEVRAGRLIFKEGERDNQSVYLLEGEVSLLAGNEIVGAITAGSDASRHPIAQQQPRQVSARAKSNVVVARVDSSLLDIMLTWDQSSGYEVAEISDDDDDDWMTRILQSQAFLKLPPSNIQRLLMKVESISVSAGEVIIRQGGDGDYFYIIKNGRCMVTRKPSANAKEVKLAELADGDAFGEDALVSDAKRNATITMMTDGVLMRLAKKDFVELLKEPLLNKLNYQDAAAKVAKGAVWLDVRLPGEYENVHIPGSRNIPLSALRLEANGLDPAVKYIVCCDTGRRSASAAFVLSQRGFEVYVLNEGLASVPNDALEGNAATAPAAAANPETADIVELKPQSAGSATAAAQTVADTVGLAALQARIDVLQQEKRTLESAQQQLGGRVGTLQEELERVRDESREQILELEQILAEARQDSSAARSELQALQEHLAAQNQNASSAHDQTELLEAELAERRAREEQLQNELKALQARAAELESVHQSDVKQWAETDSERARLQARVDELQALAEQAEAQRTQITTLEAALQSAAQQGDQTQAQQAQQAQRLGELEAALQVATAALERAHQETEQRIADLQAARDQALQQAQADAAQQLAALQTQLDEAAALGKELDARLTAAQAQEGEAASEQQSLREALAALQVQLEAEHLQLDEQRARAESHAQELAQLRETQAAALETAHQESEHLRAELDAQQTAHNALLAERDALSAATADSARNHADLQVQLQEARARIEALQADAGSQVQQLQSELETVREQLQLDNGERAALEAARAALLTERDALQNALDEARAHVEALSADVGEQVRQLETLLAETRNQVHSETEARSAVAEELASVQARASELDAALQTQTLAAQALQDRLQAAEQALAATQAEQVTQQQTHAAAQSALADLEARLADAENAALQARDAHESEMLALRAQLAAQDESQSAGAEQIAALEQRLAAAEKEAAQLTQEHAAAIAALQADLAAAERARAELAEQQADAASGQNEQTQQLARLREELRVTQSQLQDADATRAEIESRLAEMSAAAAQAQAALQQAEQTRAQALTEAEQRGRAALESKVEELRSELDGARAALAREQSQRGNLEQATRAEFDASRAEIAARLEQAELELMERRQTIAEAEAARKALEAQLAETRGAAVDQQQALVTELEELREATTADLQAMHKQMQQLQDDLKAARRLGAGGSADEEIERLRLLLDEAREEANSARSDAEQWREHATSMPAASVADPQVDGELAAMRITLADVQSRVDEALQLREIAEQEVVQLRQALQTQQQQAAPAAPSRQDTPPAQRGGLWLGLAAGVIMGAIGAGSALWFGGGAQTPTEAAAVTPAITQSAQGDAAQPAIAVPVSKSAPVAAKPVVKPAGEQPDDPGAAEKVAVSKGRALRDTLPDGSRGPQLVEIAAAEFSMGSSANSMDFDERPRHAVKLRRFAIAAHEVTFEEYDAFTRATGRRLPDDKGWGRGRRPVINVSWEEAVAYTQWLSEQTGRRYRLPTEAEWEYAAGGFVRSLYWWGNSPGEGRANCFNCGSDWDAQSSAPVGRFTANPLGVYDTAGNVAEWVQDCYHPNYEGAPADGSAWVEVGCARRVVRGGGFNSPASSLRIAKRDQHPVNMRADDLGFRVVREF